MHSDGLGHEEYVEQAHFFHALGERLASNVPAQEVLASVREEVLATTKLPIAIDFLLGELRHAGVLGPAMARLPHYFTPFQAYVIQESENERLRFDLRIGLEILSKEAEYRAGESNPQGVFLYQLEAISRNRLGYDRGLAAMAGDPSFDAMWQAWIRKLRRQIGMVDLADLIYVHSQYYWQRQASDKRTGDSLVNRDTQRIVEGGGGRLESGARSDEDAEAASVPTTTEPDRSEAVILFGEREGRIALANRHKDPLYLFASLQRQLGYPTVPRPKAVDQEQALLPQLARRVEQLESRLKIMEEEQRGGLDLSKFYERPPEG